MADVGMLAGLVGNVATGGLFGLAGSLIGVVAKGFHAKQAAKERASEREHELTLIRISMEQGQHETEDELQILKMQNQGRAKEASYTTSIAVAGVSQWVNNVRALFRPLLTVLLNIAAIAVLFYLVNSAEKLSAYLLLDTPVSSLVSYTIQSLFFASSTATVWWFGDRALTPPELKHK